MSAVTAFVNRTTSSANYRRESPCLKKSGLRTGRANIQAKFKICQESQRCRILLSRYGKYFSRNVLSRSEPYTAIQNNQEVEVIDFVYNEYKHCSALYKPLVSKIL